MDSCAEESRPGSCYERRAMTGFSWLHILAVAMFVAQATNWITLVTLWSIANPFLSPFFSPVSQSDGVWGWAQYCRETFCVWDTDFSAFA